MFVLLFNQNYSNVTENSIHIFSTKENAMKFFQETYHKHFNFGDCIIQNNSYVWETYSVSVTIKNAEVDPDPKNVHFIKK